MKLKFTKTLAIACILCMTLATLTAFADVTVRTITNYDYEAAEGAEMTITTTVGGLTEDGEITYYVANDAGIVYIDQATAADNTATFTFVAPKNEVLTATAKNGSDQGYAFPTFEFNDGCNLITEGTAKVTKTADWGVYSEEYAGYVFKGVVSGNTKAYGITITADGEAQELAAMGCNEDGTFAIVVQNIDATELASVAEFAR